MSDDGTERYACADTVNGCVNVAPCGCFEDHTSCTLGLQGLCVCEAPADPCGGCADGKRCIYQHGGPGSSRYLCAAAMGCQGSWDCDCIQQQGSCWSGQDEPVCQCENGLD